MCGFKSVTTSDTYQQFYDGRCLARAWATSPWRMSNQASNASGSNYTKVPANFPVILAIGLPSFGRGESGAVDINFSEILPPA